MTLLDWLGAARVAASLRGAGGASGNPRQRGGDIAAGAWRSRDGSVGSDSALHGPGDRRRGAALRTLGNESAAAGTALLTRDGARAVIDMLADAPPPAGLSVLSPRRIAYKTGTSFGFRDAWAFGSLPGVTAGIWVGRPDGTPRPGAFARGTAAPLLFHVFDLLPDQPGWPVPAATAADGPLAPGLRHLHLREDRDFTPNLPRIVFPPAGAGLELHGGQALALEAAGGTPPYRWIVNGVPLPAPKLGSPPSWQPDGAGFAHLTVTDSADLSVEEDIRVQ